MKYFPTPWGNADRISYLNDERTVIRVQTSGHGGIGVQIGVEMPKHLDVGMLEGQWRWFEEDQDWAIVALAFPACFDEKSVQGAKETVRNFSPSIYEQHFGLTSSLHQIARRLGGGFLLRDAHVRAQGCCELH